MKYRTFLVTSIIIILVAILLPRAFAHSGKTDSNGGHYDRSTGEYHYHHGYSAHQHYDGECPYDFDDKTNHDSGSSNSNSSNSNNSSHNSSSNSGSTNSTNSSITEHTKDTITFGEVITKVLMFFPFLFLSFCLLSIFNPLVNGTIHISNKRVENFLYILHLILIISVAIIMTIFIE